MSRPLARGGFLTTLNPLTTLGVVLPAMIAMVFVRDVATPLAVVALAYVVLLAGLRPRPLTLVILLLAVPAMVVMVTIGFALWVDPARVAATPVAVAIGEWRLYTGALERSFATGVRFAAIMALAFIPGLSATGEALVRSSIQHLRVPYRVGYAALAAYRFVPRFRYELGVIRAAHRVRGHHGGRGPFAAVTRGLGYAVPLLASGIRHAERVALSMDARAFGAYTTRTERYRVPFRTRDAIFAVLFLAAFAAIVVACAPWR